MGEAPLKPTVLLASLFCLASFLTARGAEEITPAHVYQAVKQVAQDVELIREVMGRPRLTAQPWIVNEAQPRHVYYQMQTLFRKVARLDRQLTGGETELPEPPTGEIEPRHVFAVVLAARTSIDRIRAELDLAYRAELPGLEPDRQPRDVLREVVQINRQLNLMLDRPIADADVYDRLALAAAYVAGTLTVDPDAPIYGTLPPFDPGKVPADVYRRVLECLSITQEIGRHHNIDLLQLNLRPELRRRDIAPSDVYHLATTLLAELAYLTLTLDAMDVDLPPIERPKHVFPSHVYRMAGMLQDELARLETDLDRERYQGP